MSPRGAHEAGGSDSDVVTRVVAAAWTIRDAVRREFKVGRPALQVGGIFDPPPSHGGVRGCVALIFNPTLRGETALPCGRRCQSGSANIDLR